MKTLRDFIENFDIVENAMEQRNLVRWNGRNLRTRENLAEHTHLVVACSMKLVDYIKKNGTFELYTKIDEAEIYRRAMYHDALELFRGDILSTTKDDLPGLRQTCDDEEDEFMSSVAGKCSELTDEIVKLADKMACYKFLEKELEFPTNDFSHDAYITCKDKFDKSFDEFCEKYNIVNLYKNFECTLLDSAFKKGYKSDAGADVILEDDVVFLPGVTTTVNLKVQVTPKENEMGFLCARTSAAKQGLSVAMCPIDTDYSGDVMAIVHNVSNNIIVYKRGEAFCQVLMVPIHDIPVDYVVKKEGRRTNGNCGSTGR